MKRFFEKFQHYLMTEKCVSNNTFQAYQQDLQQFISFIEKEYAISSVVDISNQHVKAFLKHLRQDRHIGAKSASRKLSALKTFTNYLSRFHDIVPFTNGVQFPQLPKNLPQHLTQEQVKNLLLTADADKSLMGQRNKVMLCLLYAGGFRASELVALKISHINFEEGCIHVCGKGGKDRIVPLTPETHTLLKSYLDMGYQKFLVGKIDIVNRQPYSDYLFPILYKGKIDHISRQTFWKFIKEIAKKSGLINPVSPHVLRHSLATHMLKQGANLRLLQTLLGHEKINTVQIYTHLEITYLRELYDKYHPRA